MQSRDFLPASIANVNKRSAGLSKVRKSPEKEVARPSSESSGNKQHSARGVSSDKTKKILRNQDHMVKLHSRSRSRSYGSTDQRARSRSQGKSPSSSQGAVDPCFKNVLRKEQEEEHRNKRKKRKLVEANFQEGDQLVKFWVDSNGSFYESENEIDQGDKDEQSSSEEDPSESESDSESYHSSSSEESELESEVQIK